ncbi:MAG: DnaJ domain-containing protein, partial [Chloroflexia bacterium]
MNPYEILRISPSASVSEIEDAYDALFDEYEPRAQEGHADAIDALNALNDARDTLVDPNRRAKLDARLARAEQPAPAPKPKAAPPRETPRPPRPPRPGGRAGAGAATIKTRRRASYALPEVKPRRSWLPLLPFFVAIAVLAFAIAVGVTYLLTRDDGVPDDLPTGATVATVNGVPIYQRELDEREAIDRNNALNDPLFSAFFDPSTITGTRALDTLKYDSLDKLINMEVIKQQAQKEGIWPTPAQQEELVRQTAAADQQPGESFKQMLARIG